jgi:hypothetical protein
MTTSRQLAPGSGCTAGDDAEVSGHQIARIATGSPISCVNARLGEHYDAEAQDDLSGFIVGGNQISRKSARRYSNGTLHQMACVPHDAFS